MNLNESRKIYKALSDDISREIFKARLIYSACSDSTAIVNLKPQYRNLSSDIERFSSIMKCMPDSIVVFGAGYYGKSINEFLFKRKIKAFIDNNDELNGKIIDGIKTYSLKSFVEMYGLLSDIKIVIAVSAIDAQQIIKKQLKEAGYKDEQVYIGISDWRNNSGQYFDFFDPRNEEAFVDCGCFDGSTAYRFAAWCGSRGYEHIYCFEADKVNYDNCKKAIGSLKNTQLFPYGLSDYNGKASFASNGKEDAHIIKEGEDSLETIDIVKLDDCIGDKRITYIKMDIEGAEYDALVGASNIIRTQKPRLAISVYHNAEHFVSIPILLLKLNPDYKLWYRQYSLLTNETILYAE